MSQPNTNSLANVDSDELAKRIVEVGNMLDQPVDWAASSLKFARFMLNFQADRLDALAEKDDLTIVRSAKAIEDSRRRLVQHTNHLLRESPEFIRARPQPLPPAKGQLYEDALEFASIPQAERAKFLKEMAQEMRRIAESDLPVEELLALVRDLESRMRDLPVIPAIS